MEELKQILLSNETQYELSNTNVSIDSIVLPVILQNKILLSEGTWNGLFFSKESIKRGFELTDWTDKKNNELIKDHADKPLSVDSFVGYVKNMHLSNKGDIDSNGTLVPDGSLMGDLELWDKDMVIKLGMAKAKFGISVKAHGVELGNGSFLISKYGNFSVVDNPACKTSYINLSDNEQKPAEENKPCEKCEKYPCECPDEEEPKEDDEEMACKKKKLEEESKELQSNILKGGLKEEHKMESKENKVEVALADAPNANEVKSEVVLEQKVEEQKVTENLNDKLLSQITELTSAIKALADRVDKIELSDKKVKELSAKVDGVAFKISKPMTVQELSSTSNKRHTNGILAMAQQVMSLQSQ